MTTPDPDRACQKMASICISTTHGQNVQLQNQGKSATWKLNKHLGICFTDRPLTKGENLKFKLKGSGHVLLGLLSAKPNPTVIEDIDPITIEPNSPWTHFRFKREITVISLNRVKYREVTFSRGVGGKTETKTISLKNQDVYVCFEIQFGDITIDIESDQLKRSVVKFDENCGANISLECQQSRAVLKNANINALCCTDRPLAKGETIDFRVTPIDNANWTYIKLFISNRNGNDLAIGQTETRLDRYAPFLFPRDGIKIDKKGRVHLRLTEYGEIEYCVRTEERKVEITGPSIDLSMPLFIFMELFRVRVELESAAMEEHDAFYLQAVHRAPVHTDEGYLMPVSLPNMRQHEYERIHSRHTPHAEITKGQCTEPPPGAPASSEHTGGYIKMYPPGKEDASAESLGHQSCDSFDDQETQLKGVSNGSDDSITELKQRTVEVHREDPTPEKVLPKGVKREVARVPQLSSDSADAEASGPIATPPVPPRQRISGSAGPDVPSYMNSLSSPAAMPLENLLRRVQVLEQETGLPVPSVENPIGTSGEDVAPFEEIIQKNYIRLLNTLEPDPIADYLFQEFKMSRSEHASFLEKDRKGKCRQILKILQSRPSTQGIFKTALNTSAQEDIATLLKL